MGYKALYREWRPRVFKDVVGQEHITETLKNEIVTGRIAHAYLFCGTRGTGKTTTAKILAKALNCNNLKDGEPCNECEMCKKIDEGTCIDVKELDAASNNGVSNIRDLIDDTNYPPQDAKYKIYILDEVHMLSQGAVNAFLKTLEEPPSNIVFILATTDPQKLPVTILSRCQRFDFKRINKESMTNRLKEIAEAKNISYDMKSLELISRVSDGAMRDAVSILDQAISMGKNEIVYEYLVNMLGLVNNEYLFDITDGIAERNIQKVMVITEKMVSLGKDMYLFIKEIISHFRNLLMVKVTNNPEEVLDMSLENIEKIKKQSKNFRVEEIMRHIRILQSAESNSKASKQSRIYLELALVKMCKIEYDTSNEMILLRINRLENEIKSGAIKVQTETKKDEDEDIKNKKVNNIPDTGKNKIKSNIKEVSSENLNKKEKNSESKIQIDDVRRAWTEILERFKVKRAMIVYASIVTAKPVEAKNGVITLKYDKMYGFNKNRLEKKENSHIVDDVFSEVLKENLHIEYIIEDSEDTAQNTEQLIKNEMAGLPIDVIDE
ncbi:DNA polymerase III subunit gamma/tau [Clostridium sp. BJN0001]|uniref:DNA polymerase III subunit gamma/tau n=1 Tax=Clostridium sp. BJN0001 TaxID=2930219 RepID=UPI001FD41B76|nr:DNA polymerase III subunit gamma/tau [Clostridium sp. BJN0001]